MSTEHNDVQGIDDVLHLAEATEGKQYLTLTLSDESYGVEILRVQEIRGWEPVTRIPNSPEYVKGIINLRGSIVPIYDLRVRFRLPVSEYTPETVVIVLRIGHKEEERHIGVVVDTVSDVIVVRDEDVVRTPEFGGTVPTESIRGLITQDDKMVMLLDVDHLIAEERGAELTAA